MSRKGAEGFERYYGEVYGARWTELRSALLSPVQQVSRINPFTSSESIRRRAPDKARLRLFGRDVVADRIEPAADPDGRLDVYVMDPASIAPAVALEVQAEDDVLDLCAAPGGKSLILAENLALQSPSGRLTSNELSDRRRARLRGVLESYLPREALERIRVTGHDGTKWCLHETDAYDKILLDAPCSGERHLLADPGEMKLWSPARSKNLAIRQYALLASAHRVVRAGGRIVYSTCSISPLENDAVIAKLLKKRPGECQVISGACELGEPTEHGWMIFPDRTGYGPMYFSVLERV